MDDKTKQKIKSTKRVRSAINFVFAARQRFGHKYDYSKVEYEYSYIDVVITCPFHGEFKQRPSEHLRSKGCPKCSNKARMIAKYGYLYNLTENKKCSDCGEEKDVTNFKKWNTKRGVRYSSYCDTCRRKKDREKYQQRDKSKTKISIKKYRESKKGKEYRKKYHYTKVNNKSDIRFVVCDCGVVECVKASNKRSKCKRCNNNHNSKANYEKTRTTKNKLCVDCGNVFDGFNGKIRCDLCNKKHKRQQRKKIKKKRMALLRGAKYGVAFNDKDVFRRDKWKCKECGCKVQKKNIYADNAAEIDHIVPVSKGGPHIPSNVQTLCRKCNQDKSDKLRGQMSLFVQQHLQNNIPTIGGR